MNSTGAKEVLEILFAEGGDPGTLVRDRGLLQVSDSGELESLVDRAIADNPGSVKDYREGKKAALQFLMGQVMRLSRGKANPKMARDLLSAKLGKDG